MRSTCFVLRDCGGDCMISDMIPKPHAILVAVLMIGVYGCATRPEKIRAKEIDPATYETWSCDQLEAEQNQLGEALTLASDEQRHDRQDDILGLILVGFPMGGGQKEVVAELMGKLEAVQEMMLRMNCAGPILEIGELIEKKKKRERNAKD